MSIKKQEPNKKTNWLSSLPKSVKAIIIVALFIIGLAAVAVYDKGGFDNIMSKNHSPEIVYAYPGMPIFNSQLTSVDAIPTKLYDLRAGIVDKDGDKLTVTFWVRSSSDTWKGIALFEGFNGTYVHTFNPSYLIVFLNINKFEWRVDVSDGKITTSEIYPMYIV